MAVSGRLLRNSTTPFSCSLGADRNKADLAYQTHVQRVEDKRRKESKGDIMENVHPIIAKVLTQGTAQVGEGPPNCWENSPFIAQAECETQESQEFSPSCSSRSYNPPTCLISGHFSEHNHVVDPTSLHPLDTCRSQHIPRKKQRKRQKRKEKKKEEKAKSRKPRPRRRVPSGVPEQESGTIRLVLQGKVSDSQRERTINSHLQGSEEQERGLSSYSYNPGHIWEPQNCNPLSDLPAFGLDGDSESLGDFTLALAGLRGSVSQGDLCFAAPFSKDMETDVRKAEENELSASEPDINEGIVFNENIRPVDYEYREGKEFTSEFIRRGAYGEVYSVRDRKTNYRFASKKIPLKNFNSGEVSTWSALKSPRVVELFGVVREGPYVHLLMEYKSGSVGQLLTTRGRLPEDIALHYYSQVTATLEYLQKRRVAHLDIKAENVLLSEDGKDIFLCDFGQSERLDHNGQSLSSSRDMKGTETHMAPEVVKGEPRGAKADVWSSCCMLLHMLNGCQPWIRNYSCLLYLQIANRPPPLREIPPDCSPLTAEILKAGLQKDPIVRASASDLKKKAVRALREVGGLTSPIRGPYKEPLRNVDHPLYSPQPSSSPAISEECYDPCELSKGPGWRENKEEEEEASDQGKKRAESTLPLLTPPHVHPKHKTANVSSTLSEVELRKLEKDFYLISLSQLYSPESLEQLLSCLNSESHSNWEQGDKKDSGRWSISPGEDLSSGVFSYNSQSETGFSMDWRGHSNLPSPRRLEGVGVCIRDFNGQNIQIREKLGVTVGHIATGISEQISERVFTMETQEGQPVVCNEVVQSAGIGLRCIPAPDHSTFWTWRIRDGVLETQD
ncbi:mitogen-activated protein kinase kinase kinase 14 [Osmerus eperlanus]|uniref:mitogen-activated protein kinase kinase kinase 14 n=1 Tax=Osmerus eperlanus TaxID=29151 RepID=UPI002E10164B